MAAHQSGQCASSEGFVALMSEEWGLLPDMAPSADKVPGTSQLSSSEDVLMGDNFDAVIFDGLLGHEDLTFTAGPGLQRAQALVPTAGSAAAQALRVLQPLSSSGQALLVPDQELYHKHGSAGPFAQQPRTGSPGQLRSRPPLAHSRSTSRLPAAPEHGPGIVLATRSFSAQPDLAEAWDSFRREASISPPLPHVNGRALPSHVSAPAGCDWDALLDSPPPKHAAKRSRPTSRRLSADFDYFATPHLLPPRPAQPSQQKPGHQKPSASASADKQQPAPAAAQPNPVANSPAEQQQQQQWPAAGASSGGSISQVTGQEGTQGPELLAELRTLSSTMQPWLKTCLRDSLYRLSRVSDVRLAGASAGQVILQPTSAYSDVDRVTSSILYKTPLAPHSYTAHPQAAMLQQAGLIGAMPAMGINDGFWPSHLQSSLPVLQPSSAPQAGAAGLHSGSLSGAGSSSCSMPPAPVQTWA